MIDTVPKGYKHVVSISLGSSKRDAREEIEILGQKFILQRIGTNGDYKKAQEYFMRLDGKVDAFGLGGADLYLIADNKRYIFNGIKKLVSMAKKTPVFDGSGLKNTLERRAVDYFDWYDKKILMTSAVDRFGMAESFSVKTQEVLYGDLIFALNLDLPIKDINRLRKIAHIVLPVMTKLPQSLFYPTGKKQEKSVISCGTKYYDWADVIAGDMHFIKRYAPKKLDNKIILTQTVTKDDLQWFRYRKAKMLITTTPKIGSRNFATNVLEALFVAHSGKQSSLSAEEYLEYIDAIPLKPEVTNL